MTGDALGLGTDKGIMGRKLRFESILMGVTACTVYANVVSGIAAICIPVVGQGVTDLAYTGGRRAYGVGKAAFWIKEFNLAGATTWGINSFTDELAIEQPKGIGLGAIGGLWAGSGTDVF